MNASRQYLQLYLLLIGAVITWMSPPVFAECFEKSAFWKFEEQAPPYLDSMNPQGTLNGVCINAASCPESVPGRFGSALKFYMNADLISGAGINIEASPQSDTLFDWSAQDSFSIEFWMKRDTVDIQRNEVIIGRDNPNTLPDQPDELHWWIGIGAPQGNIRAHINARPLSLKSESGDSIRGDHNKYLNSKKIICDNAWHHVVFVRDARLSEIRLYIDGMVEDKHSVIYTDMVGYTAFASKTANLNIGWLLLSQGYHYKGILDELAIYDLVLPAWYIEQRYFTDERVDPCQ